MPSNQGLANIQEKLSGEAEHELEFLSESPGRMSHSVKLPTERTNSDTDNLSIFGTQDTQQGLEKLEQSAGDPHWAFTPWPRFRPLSHCRHLYTMGQTSYLWWEWFTFSFHSWAILPSLTELEGSGHLQTRDILRQRHLGLGTERGQTSHWDHVLPDSKYIYPLSHLLAQYMLWKLNISVQQVLILCGV